MGKISVNDKINIIYGNNVLGDLFPVFCGVRQEGVLSPVLFALYIDVVISELKISGHDVHVGSLFIGCVLYADDIVLLSASCHGLQQPVNICNVYDMKWDIKFNRLKSQLITFGNQNPRGRIMLNGNQKPWVNKMKYFGVHFCCNTGITLADLSDICRNFYGQFNSILSVAYLVNAPMKWLLYI